MRARGPAVARASRGTSSRLRSATIVVAIAFAAFMQPDLARAQTPDGAAGQEMDHSQMDHARWTTARWTMARKIRER